MLDPQISKGHDVELYIGVYPVYSAYYVLRNLFRKFIKRFFLQGLFTQRRCLYAKQNDAKLVYRSNSLSEKNTSQLTVSRVQSGINGGG